MEGTERKAATMVISGPSSNGQGSIKKKEFSDMGTFNDDKLRVLGA